MIRLFRTCLILLPSTIVMAIVGGCMDKVSIANTLLRKQQQTSSGKIDALDRQHAADAATIAAYQKSNGSLQTLSTQQFDELFTVHGLSLKRLTGGFNADPKSPGDDSLKIYVVPTDDEDQPIKAVGEFVVDAFGLGKDDAPLQSWKFSAADARKAWLGQGLLYEFVLTCPFKTPPTNPKLRVAVTFTDSLTHRQFSAQKIVTLQTAGTHG